MPEEVLSAGKSVRLQCMSVVSTSVAEAGEELAPATPSDMAKGMLAGHCMP